METFTFDQIHQIQDFQFLSDSSGIILDENGVLYKFGINETELIETPDNFKISHFHFINESDGAIIGSSCTLEKEVQKGSIGSFGSIIIMPFLLLLLVGKLMNSNKSGLNFFATLLAALIVSTLAISCSTQWQLYKSQDPSSKFSTIITSNQFWQASFHYYPVNKKQVSFISITNNQGKEWTTHKIPTHFYPTALTSVGENFFVGTYANEREGDIPIHGDGDIYIYGNDTSLSKRLLNNNFENPYSMAARRGIKGLRYFPNDSLLFAYGSERMPTWPKHEVSTTDGNILQIHANLKPNYKIIDVPDSVSVQSLSRSGNNDLWVTLESRKLHTVDGKSVYFPLDRKKLLHFNNGTWDDVIIQGINSFKQVEFIPDTQLGYALSENGAFFETVNGGKDWNLTAWDGVKKMRSWNRSIALLVNNNTLVLYDTSISKSSHGSSDNNAEE